MTNKRFGKFHDRLKKESVIKSVLFGIIIGFGADIIISVISWIVARRFESWFGAGLGLSIGVGIAAGCLGAAFLYYKVFRPSDRSVAERLDGMGLEERNITMNEFYADTSPMAEIQRANAVKKLHSIDEKSLGFAVSKALIAVAAVVGVLGLALTSVGVLSESGVIPSPAELFPLKPNPADFYSVVYAADEGGHIEGEVNQTVYKGEDGKPVVAVPDEGFVFAGWSDEVENFERCERAVRQPMYIVAQFKELVPPDDPNANDSEQMTPPDEEEQSPAPDENQENDNNTPDDSGGGRYDAGNQIIDGETPYWDVFPGYDESTMKELAENKDLTPEQRAVIEAYFEYLRSKMNQTSDSGNE